MSGSRDIDRARIILEAVRLASSAEVASLHELIAREPETLQLELILRILLTYLPESTEPNVYLDLLHQLARGAVHAPPPSSIRPVQPGKDLSDDDARHQVRQSHLLPLAEEQDLQAGCTDILSLFLVHRARKIDAETGSISEIEELLKPFVDHDPYLCSWTVSNILPLRRLNYEYNPQDEDLYTLDGFEKLDGRPAIDSLLSRSALVGGAETIQSARDIRGIVGPWIYGESRRKRRKTHHDRRRSSLTSPRPAAGQGAKLEEGESRSSWSDVNDWILELGLRHFAGAADTLERWDGPGDVDYDGYSVGNDLTSDTLKELTRPYAQAGLAVLYASSETSSAAFDQAYVVLRKVARLSNFEEPPPLDELQTFSEPHTLKEYLGHLSEVHLLHNALLRPENPMTTPIQASLSFARFILSSCVLFLKLGNPKRCGAVAELAAFASCEKQLDELRKTLQKAPVKTRDESSWTVVRHQILWLRDWQYQASGIGNHDREECLGVFRNVKRVDVEVELLRALLRASCYNLAVHTYCMQDEHPIPVETIEKTVLSVAMSFYDGASNGNRTRGGVRKASEILSAFQSHFPESTPFSEANALLAATHSMSFYSLTLQHGVPFQPVNLRASKDPMLLIGKILEQNPRSFTKLDDLIEIGQNLVRAGLGPARISMEMPHRDQNQQMSESSRRVTSMAIEAALSEGDFDTAYSYIVNRLSPTIPNSPSPSLQTVESTNVEDDISWRVAYLAGRSSPSKLRPSPPSLRRLEQRLELLSLSLLLAPPSHLPEILHVWRTVETNLTALLARESAEEDQWNTKGDRRSNATNTTTLPGGFAPSTAEVDRAANLSRPRRQSRATAAAANEDAPMGLFDVARGAAKALQKSAFPLRAAGAGAAAAAAAAGPPPSEGRPRSVASDSGSETKGERVRKRDLVANAVAGGLASGIGWVIGAPAPGKG